MDRTDICSRLEEMRARTLQLVSPLSDDALRRQHSPLMSPVVWDLGHIAAFEELWLVDRVGRLARKAELDPTYDPGRTPRAARGTLELPGAVDVLTRLAAVRERTRASLHRLDVGALHGSDRLLRRGYVYDLVLSHEAQHQETILQTIHLMSGVRYEPVERRRVPGSSARPSGSAAGVPPGADGTLLDTGGASAETSPRDHARDQWVHVPAGPFEMGGPEDGFAYDNELPRHPARTGEFEIGRHPVSNAGWLEFMAAGGYTERSLWSEAGWAWRGRENIVAPLFWEPAAEALIRGAESGMRADGISAAEAARHAAAGEPWVRRNALGETPVDPDRPVVHVCCHEAEAYARFRGARLPTEAEWEKAAGWDPATGRTRSHPWGEDPAPEAADSVISGEVSASPTEGAVAATPANLDQLAFGVAPLGAYPLGASPLGCEHMLGDVWEWTSSPFTAYPEFEAFPYEEYSAVFFGDEYRVLRGGSWATRPSVARVSFRNWDFPIRRQIFAGVRLARDV